ncbi:Hypothetical protein LUCI_3401 [Lucifera butyrica]|uniref:Type iv pilin n-term methylation site gfxxxe n=1 Tax=Lucifera butyrica TaxID=1351585 RepID=A0A498R5Y5_9FIRM|nr:type II secretion system protein [Lucifera butyrica]VBB08136.1 Hypothetical protein LUCI_3401 [Lucifera butyrica]
MVKSQKGFLLIDVLIAMVILGSAIMAMSYAYAQYVKEAAAAKNYNQAVYLAKSLLEDMKQYDGKSAIPLANYPTHQNKFNNNDTTFTVYQPVETDINSKLAAIKVKVTWNEANSQRQIEIVGYYYQP